MSGKLSFVVTPLSLSERAGMRELELALSPLPNPLPNGEGTNSGQILLEVTGGN